MSETQQETEVVAGAISAIVQKRADTWQVAVRPAGSQYDKNLWTKNAELVAALSSRIGESDVFQCNVSYWTNQSQQQVRSLWISRLGGEVAAPAVATASPAQKPTEPDVDWDEKERRAIRSKAWAHTISLLGPQVRGDGLVPTTQDLMQWSSQYKFLVELIYADICRSHSFAHPDLGADTPFGEDFQPPFD